MIIENRESTYKIFHHLNPLNHHLQFLAENAQEILVDDPINTFGEKYELRYG